MSVVFWLAALMLCLLAAAFLLVPALLSRGTASDSDRTRVNVQLYEDRLAELEASRDGGDISQSEYETLEAELQKNLLSETSAEGAAATAPARGASGSGRLPIVVAALLPLVAIVLYSWWGAIADMELAEDLQRLDPQDTEAVRQTISRLAERMEDQPDNDHGWFILANSYRNLEEYDAAANAFERLLDRYPDDPNLASNYAETLFMAAGRTVTSEVEEAADRALDLNPHNLPMLELMGMSAFREGELASARDYFQRALAGAGGERARMLEQAIARVEGVMRERGQEPPDSADETGATAGRSINVRVAASSSVDMPSDSTVFIFARAVGGPPMPLAVSRHRFRDLPVDVRLDESMAMMQGMGLADFDTVEIVARVTRSGGVTARAGDYEVKSDPVDLTGEAPQVELVVETPVGGS